VRAARPDRNVKTRQRGQSARLVHVSAAAGNRSRGHLRIGDLALPVALGRTGIQTNKREGDGSTPRGRFRLLRLWWRPDRLPRPPTRLPIRRIGESDAWCEDPNDRRYNRAIKLSPSSVGDRLKRDDHLYNLVIEIDHNTRPRVKNRGSAVFIHVARPGFAPTAGCVALEARSLRRLLPRLSNKTLIDIR
jgi:L,D-peptidoglycan transpeptidase YkuD (ErfK/YbiS/YcfS/YnhG family)